MALGLHGLYNFARFGSVLATGYNTAEGTGLDFGTNPLVGLYGLLLSPGRGAFLFAPPLIAAFWAANRFRDRQPRFAVALTLLILPWLIVHACWRDWNAGWGWGPRYLLPLLPLALLPLAECWADRRARIAALSLTVLGVLVQVPGVGVDFVERGVALDQAYREGAHYL